MCLSVERICHQTHASDHGNLQSYKRTKARGRLCTVLWVLEHPQAPFMLSSSKLLLLSRTDTLREFLKGMRRLSSFLLSLSDYNSTLSDNAEYMQNKLHTYTSART